MLRKDSRRSDIHGRTGKIRNRVGGYSLVRKFGRFGATLLILLRKRYRKFRQIKIVTANGYSHNC